MSSWFDPSGIASLAKNALKEAQKTIDKALDIQDEDNPTSAASFPDGSDPKQPAPVSRQPNKTQPAASGTLKQSSAEEQQLVSATPAAATGRMRQSQSSPALPSDAAASTWGSFAGAFFTDATGTIKQPQSGDAAAVTTPPTASGSTPAPGTAGFRPRSVQSRESSVSNSVELVSPGSSSLLSPQTPDDQRCGLAISSPNTATNTATTTTEASSSSVGILADTSSCSCSEHSGDSEQPRTVSSTPSDEQASGGDAMQYCVAHQMDLLGGDEELELAEAGTGDEEDEEDSRSFNTVAECAAGHPAYSGTLHLDLQVTASPATIGTTAEASVKSASIATIATDDHLSDSTHSFEYVLAATAPTTAAGGSADAAPDSSTSATCITSTTVNTTATPNRPTSAAAAAANNKPGDRTESPASSASDIVKITSSGHTSGDDAETATSSDIEIISSPTTGGDSSSTNSVCKVSQSMCGGSQSTAGSTADNKGHTRDPSTASDDGRFGAGALTAAEAAQLRRQHSELAEVLEARELKLVDVARECAELHERCARLQHSLDGKRKRDASAEVGLVTEEYTQRLAALEKKFQALLRERDGLREQLESARREMEGRVAREVVERGLKDKEFVIGELQSEGEKLSKQVLHSSNIIKKLRTKERDSDVTLKSQSEQIGLLTTELDRLKRSLSAKDEVERTQIEAVHRLSGTNRRLERDCAQLRSALDDAEQKCRTLQTSFEAARREVQERSAASAQLARTAEQLAAAEALRSAADARREQMAAELAVLRDQLRGAESGTSGREAGLRAENRALLQRLEELELRLEEQQAAVTVATVPLVRQAEALQRQLNSRQDAWDRQERELLARLEQATGEMAEAGAERRRASAADEKAAEEVRRLEGRLAEALARVEQVQGEAQSQRVEWELGGAEERRRGAEREAVVERQRRELEEGRAEVEALRREVAELRQVQQQQQQQARRVEVEATQGRSLDEEAPGAGTERQRSRDNSSPTLSVGRLSVADSLSSNLWQLDDIDSMSQAGRSSFGMPSGSGGGAGGQLHHAPLLESLQSTLKQRDGENQQLQWELSRQQADRNYMMAEISTLSEQVEDLKESSAANDGAAEQLADVQRRYDALLQMYGEKVEEVQELHLDLDDVKEMYRGQIDELLRQQREAANRRPAPASAATTAATAAPAAAPAAAPSGSNS